jgi:hypothetical protein
MQKVSGKSKAIVHKGGWFRMYADILNDPKVQLLPDRLFKFWVNCLALTSERRGYLPNAREISFRLHLSLTEVEDDLACLMSHGLIDAEKVAGKTVLQPHNWFDWQPAPDPSKHRMRRLRERRKSTGEEAGDGGVTEGVTRHVTESAYSTSTSTVVPDNLSIQEKVSTTVEGMYAREVVR